MEAARRQHVILAIILAAIGVFLAVWGCPYLRLFGHERMCIALFAVLVLVFIYGRVERPKPRRTLTSDHR